MRNLLLILFAGLVLMPSCSKDEGETSHIDENDSDSVKIPQPFTFYSSAFDSGQAIPSQYTCDGADIIPPLSWENAPDSTKSFALIVTDPDYSAGIWTHWVVFNIAADVKGNQEGSSPRGSSGLNDWNTTGYRGPCPPSGTHHYHFNLYALDAQLQLSTGASKAAVQSAMSGHILEVKQLIGTYTR